jgi:hypothetical protein
VQAPFGGALGIRVFELVQVKECQLCVPHYRGVQSKKVRVEHEPLSLSQYVICYLFA